MIQCTHTQGAKSVILITTHGGGAIYCTGDSSCRGDIALDSSGDIVYCLGAASCAFAHIQGARVVICGAEGACQSTRIHSAGQDVTVYALAFEASMSVQVECDIGDVCFMHCEGYGSCDGAKMLCHGLDQCEYDCHGDDDYMSKYCPVITTAEPGVAPTAAPIRLMPTLPPTPAPTSRPTFNDDCGRDGLYATGVCLKRVQGNVTHSMRVTCNDGTGFGPLLFEEQFTNENVEFYEIVHSCTTLLTNSARAKAKEG